MAENLQPQFEIFLSYSRKDNVPSDSAQEQAAIGWVTALRDQILQDHRQFSTEPLRIFFDQDDIRDMDDWRHRILHGLRSSKILLVCLSPNYFASEYCQWEWDEYVRRQVHQLMGSESVATVYFVEVPGSNEQLNARRLDELLRGNFTDIRPWFSTGVRALQETEVQRRMAKLGESLWQRLQRARRAMGVPGNLRWQNPHFVGRRDELRKLHEQLGKGAVGVVTAVMGLGGQGKTELAVAYAHAWADCYPAGLWSLAAEGKKELLPLIGNLAWERALGFSPTEAEKNDPVLLGRGVLEHLKTRAAAVRERDPDQGAAALLLLDNVSEAELLSPAQLATLPGGMGADWLRIVATTRLDLREQKDRLAILPVDALDEETALSLIRDHQQPREAQRQIVADFNLGHPQFASAVEEAAAREIVRALGGFTLAVEQVALYLGLHPEVTPSSFLKTLQDRGLPIADTLPTRDPDVAAQMLTQSKQLGLILDATLAMLDAPARTALQFAALLPPDCVPWPWLRELTLKRHPELAAADDLGADPWLAVQRRLSGLRLLTSGDQPEIARIHRLVAVHLRTATTEPQFESSADSAPYAIPVSHSAELIGKILLRTHQINDSPLPPQPWELDSLLAALPITLGADSSSSMLGTVAQAALFLSEKVILYRNLPSAYALVLSCQAAFQRLAEADPLCSTWQRYTSVSFVKLGDLVTAQGNLYEAQRLFLNSFHIAQRLAESDPANTMWQRDLAVSLSKLGHLAKAQGKLSEALNLFGKQNRIVQQQIESNSANTEWQRELFISSSNLGDVAVSLGDFETAEQMYRQVLGISQQLSESDPSNVAKQRDLLVSLDRLGDLVTSRGNLPEAQRLCSESLYITQRLADADPRNSNFQRDLSVSFEKLGALAMAQGDLAEAQRLFNELLRIRQGLVTADPANTEWQRDLSVALLKVGELATAQANLPEARHSFAEALRIAQQLAESDPANAIWQRDLAVSLRHMSIVSPNEMLAKSYLHQCLKVLDEMIRRGMHLDRSALGVHRQLQELDNSQPVVSSADHSRPEERVWMPPPRDDNAVAKLLAAGDFQSALDLLRPIVFPSGAFVMDQRTPLDSRVAFLHALMLGQKVDILETHLGNIPEQDDPRVRQIVETVAAWRKGLSFGQRMGVVKKPPLPRPELA